MFRIGAGDVSGQRPTLCVAKASSPFGRPRLHRRAISSVCAGRSFVIVPILVLRVARDPAAYLKCVN